MAANSLPSGKPAAVPAPVGAVPAAAASEPSLGAVFQTVLIVLGVLVLIPGIDLAVSGLFFDAHWTDPARNFYFRQAYLTHAVTSLIYLASIGGGLILGFTFLYALSTRSKPQGLNSRAWGFLFAAFLLGPGLLTNVVFKDHWHRARPAQIQEFGGSAKFSPALIISDQCKTNCSFVAGDPAPVFFLHAFAFLVPNRRRQKQILLASIGGGLAVGLLRIAAGAHFLSDVLFSGAVVILATALLHTVLYGGSNTVDTWKRWLGLSKDEPAEAEAAPKAEPVKAEAPKAEAPKVEPVQAEAAEALAKPADPDSQVPAAVI